MAESKKDQEKITVSEPPKGREEELVNVRIFKDGDRYKDDVFVAVNGQRLRIKRGVEVPIKRKFVEVLENSAAQDEATADMINTLEVQSKAKALE